MAPRTSRARFLELLKEEEATEWQVRISRGGYEHGRDLRRDFVRAMAGEEQRARLSEMFTNGAVSLARHLADFADLYGPVLVPNRDMTDDEKTVAIETGNHPHDIEWRKF